MRTSMLSFCLSVGLIAGAAHAQFRLDPMNPAFQVNNGGIVKIFHIGPISVPAGFRVGNKILPGEHDKTLPIASPGDVFMTGFDSRIVDTRLVATKPAELYLHHSVFMKRGVQDPTCPRASERFVASGAERIPVMLPPGYGYRLRSTDRLLCNLHIQNFTLKPRTCYYQYSMTLQPASKNLTEVRPWWIDVVNCSSSYIIQPGTGQHFKSAEFTVPRNMDLLTIAPHLHCYGAYLDVDNVTTNTRIKRFINYRQCEVDMRAERLNPPLRLTSGHKIRITSVYNRRPNDIIDAMGIMLSYVVYK